MTRSAGIGQYIRFAGEPASSEHPEVRAIAIFKLGKRGCHGLGVIDKAVLLYIRTAIPKTGSPWHPSLKKAIALQDQCRFIQNGIATAYHSGMIAQFALQLVLGMSLVWALLPRHQITGGFFRIQMMIAMALGVLAALTVGRLGADSATGGLFVARIACGAIAAAGYAGAVLWLLNQRAAGAACVYVILGAALTGLIATQGPLTDFTATRGFLLTSQTATAAVLGSAVSGMLLGHWYLTATTMSIDPLKRASLLFGAAVVLRLVVSVVGWSMSGGMLTDGTHWTWFALRWLAGIIGPLVIAVMAVQILKFRNTQAATGVLFAGVILSFIGELSAALLYSELHVAL